MKIKKFNLATFVTFASLFLVGCGGDSDDTGAKQNDGNNSISINIFDSKYNVADKKDAIKRIQWVFEDGNRQLIEKDLISVNKRGGLNNNDRVVLGNNFQSLLSKDMVQLKVIRLSMN